MREPEPELVRRAARGDTDAFGRIVASTLPDVYRLAHHLVGDAEVAQDVTQDAYLEAFRSLHRFRGDARFTTWLCRIVRNRCVDTIRRAQRERALPAQDHRPDDHTERIALHACIDALPAQLRQTFVLVEVFGFPYGEAASVLGVPAGTVKSRMHHARRRLIEALAEDAREV